MKSLQISILVLSFCFFSCNDVPKEVQQVLELAGENKVELQKVIDHYQAPKDSLKLKAAYFLIGNMTYKYSLTGQQLNNYNVLFDKIEAVSKKKPFNYTDRIDNKFYEVDSIWKEIADKEGSLNRSNLEINPDIQYMTSNYLIENIEYAFKSWKFPWSTHLNFDEFCEYILPYRFRDEVLTSWRANLINDNLSLLDSLKNIKDPVVLCHTINEKPITSWKYSRVLTKYPVTMTLENMKKGKMGSCTHQAGLGVFVMRALGVPVVHEQVPHYGNRSLGHDFNAVLGKNNKFLDFEVGNINNEGIVKKSKKINYLIPKIYRQTFSFNKESLASINHTQEEIPPYFRNPSIKDVTAQYFPVVEVEIEVEKQKKNYVYLCVFDNQTWRAVAWTKIKKKKALFKNMGKGFVYMPMYYGEQGFFPAGSPIIVKKNGEIKHIESQSCSQQMVLRMKYPNKEQYNYILLNGKFQGANTKDFKDAKTLYIIKDTLEAPIPHKAEIVEPTKFRYIRYLFPEKNKGTIAEISFFSKNTEKLQGSIIASKDISLRSDLENVFDGDVLSFLRRNDKIPGTWIGLDVGTSKRITKISFCPRTGKNNIWKDLNYELFCWNNKWISLGVQKADKYSLNYKSPVSNALYLLKCLNEGKEERIFTYEDNKQIWW